MSFFVTSVGKGKWRRPRRVSRWCRCPLRGARQGRRRHRHQLARLSEARTAPGGDAGVNARGPASEKGPWQNVKGRRGWPRAWKTSHSDANNLKQADGADGKRRGPQWQRRSRQTCMDMLTGSDPQGPLFPRPAATTTCGNWTKSAEGLGHLSATTIVRGSKKDTPPHESPGTRRTASRGCSPDLLKASGRARGCFYCFLAN